MKAYQSDRSSSITYKGINRNPVISNANVHHVTLVALSMTFLSIAVTTSQKLLSHGTEPSYEYTLGTPLDDENPL